MTGQLDDEDTIDEREMFRRLDAQGFRVYMFQRDLLEKVFARKDQGPRFDYFCVSGGKLLGTIDDAQDLHREATVQVCFRLRGGKGGFGSLLKSFRISKSTNKLMMRDLNGRRLASVREEERLKRWIEKAAQREKEKQDKKQQKIDKLKRGQGKHHFDDPAFSAQREAILDGAHDAFEAGFAILRNRTSRNSQAPSSSSSSSDGSNSEGEDVDALLADWGPSSGSRKRTADASASCSTEKKPKIDGANESDDDDDEEVDDMENLQRIYEYFVAKRKEKETAKRPAQAETQKKPKVEKPAPETREIREFPAIDLNSIESTGELEKLGLEHLRDALEKRNMKCGGSLSERATRLFAIKGLTPDQYPDNILTPAAFKERKIKQAEEERKKKEAKKSSKKSKKDKEKRTDDK